MRIHWLIAASTLVWVASTQPARAQGESASAGEAESQASDAVGESFLVQGGFDAGFRVTDTNGNRNKYFEDVNLRSGPRLFNLDLNVTPVNDAPFDLLNVYGSNLGGDPFESFGVTLKKHGAFNFRYRRTKSAYFYRDTLLPHDQTSVTASNAGDFNTFNFDRTREQIDFDFHLADRTKAFVHLTRQARVGDSTTVLDLSRDEFELDQPLDQINNDYTVGFQTDLGKVSLYVDETYREYRSAGRTFLPGASPGEDPANATEMFFFEQLLPFDFEMPQTTVRINARPSPRLTVTAGLIYSDLDADLSLGQTTRGIGFDGAPIDSVSSGTGGLSRTTKLADVDVSFDVIDRLALIGGVRFSRFDQEAAFLELGESTATGVEIASDILEVGAQVYATPTITVTGGLRTEQRETRFLESAIIEEVDDPGHEAGLHVDTARTTVFVNGSASPTPRLSLFAEYERGDYDNPFTLVAPTSVDRVKARVRVRPTKGLTFTGVVLSRWLENDLALPIHPTEPRTGASATMRQTNATLHAAYARDSVEIYGSYSRHELSNDIRNLVTTAPGFQGGQTFPWESLYEADIDRGSGGVKLAVTQRVTLGSDLSAYRSRGSFGLDWEQYRVFTELLSPAGYLVHLSYRYNALDEVQFDFDDYSAHIAEVSIGYRFR
jgi:hypothetical protein